MALVTKAPFNRKGKQIEEQLNNGSRDTKSWGIWRRHKSKSWTQVMTHEANDHTDQTIK